MKLRLENSWLVIAKEDIKDDAYEMWEHCEYENKYKAAPAAFYARNGIKKDSEYLYIEFVSEQGEAFFHNCSKLLHEMMIKFKLYPLIILNCFL